MIRLKNLALSSIAVTVAALTTGAFAAEGAPIAPAAKETCADIKWNPAFLTDFPKAPAACQDVTVKDGVKYAKFDGKVAKVDAHFVEVAIADDAGLPISTIAFQIGVGGRITINDKVEKVKDLKLGDQLTFWVREGQFGISPTLTDEPMKIVKPDAMPAT
jgi:hypothetical protein